MPVCESPRGTLQLAAVPPGAGRGPPRSLAGTLGAALRHGPPAGTPHLAGGAVADPSTRPLGLPYGSFTGVPVCGPPCGTLQLAADVPGSGRGRPLSPDAEDQFLDADCGFSSAGGFPLPVRCSFVHFEVPARLVPRASDCPPSFCSVRSNLSSVQAGTNECVDLALQRLLEIRDSLSLWCSCGLRRHLSGAFGHLCGVCHAEGLRGS